MPSRFVPLEPCNQLQLSSAVDVITATSSSPCSKLYSHSFSHAAPAAPAAMMSGRARRGQQARGFWGARCAWALPTTTKNISLVFKMLAPEVLAGLIPLNRLRSQIRPVAARTSASQRDCRRGRNIPPNPVQPTKYALTADLPHVNAGNGNDSRSPFARLIGLGRGTIMTFRMTHNQQHICIDRTDKLGKPAAS
jgi:hypothetical protein